MNKNKALCNYISKFFSMHPSRLIFMVEMILALIKVGSVQQQKIAQGTRSKTKIKSIIRRIQRFFEQEFLCPQIASKLIFSLFTWPKKIIFTLDRTNWKFGKFDINFLVICAVYNDYSIPICWILLPHRGSSKTSDRINVIEMLLLIVPSNRIQFLLADREFVGSEWFQYLSTENIPFCIRLKGNTLVIDTHKGGTIKINNLFRQLSVGQSRELHQKIFGIYLRTFSTRTETGELLILAISGDNNTFDAYEAFELYRKRWSIETMFKAFKSSGFNFEDTHLHNLDRLYKMMILLAIAYSWAIRIGEIKNNIVPIKIKNHGRREFSFFRYGLQVIQSILLKGAAKLQKNLMFLVEKITLGKRLFPGLCKITVVY